MTRAHRESRRKKDAPQLQKHSYWPWRPLKAKRRPSWLLQQQGCHFRTKGCQNPRARGSQGAAARDLPVPISLETCDPATRRTSGPVSPKPPSAPATRRVTQKWKPREGLLPLQDPPQPAEGALEVLALRPLPQGERPAELRARLRSRRSLLRAVPLLLLAHHERHRHDGARWHRRVGPALFFTDDLAARSRRQFLWCLRLESRIDGVESPRESHRRRQDVARAGTTPGRSGCSRGRSRCSCR